MYHSLPLFSLQVQHLTFKIYLLRKSLDTDLLQPLDPAKNLCIRTYLLLSLEALKSQSNQGRQFSINLGDSLFLYISFLSKSWMLNPIVDYLFQLRSHQKLHYALHNKILFNVVVFTRRLLTILERLADRTVLLYALRFPLELHNIPFDVTNYLTVPEYNSIDPKIL